MTLLSLLVVLIVVGLVMYLINNFLPLDAKYKSLLNVVVIVFVIIWLIQALGFLAPFSQIRIGRP